MRRLHAVISGEVQGVFFRASTREKAQELGLTGWVRNLPTGSVEVVAEGDAGALSELLAWCHQGPELAEVSSVVPHWSTGTGEFESFTIHH